jgi:hypothetical protein
MAVQAAVVHGQLLLVAETHHQLHQAKEIMEAQVLVRRVLQQVVAVVEQAQRGKTPERLVLLRADQAVPVQHRQSQDRPSHTQVVVVVEVTLPITPPAVLVVAVMAALPLEQVQMVCPTPVEVEVVLAGLVDLLPVQVGQAL